MKTDKSSHTRKSVLPSLQAREPHEKDGAPLPTRSQFLSLMRQGNKSRIPDTLTSHVPLPLLRKFNQNCRKILSIKISSDVTW